MFRNHVPKVALLLALILGACAGGDAATPTTVVETTTTTAPTTTAAVETTTTVDDGFPVTVEWNGVETTVESRPEAIVSLSPTATEMLFAVGAGPQVVAVDEYSYYPEEAPVTDLSGFTPNLEAIVSYEPDLVIVSDDIDGIAGALDGVGVTTLVLPAVSTIDEVYDQIRVVGAATGNADSAESVASAMEAEIDALVASVDMPATPLSYYHELGSDGGGSFYSVTSSTFIGEVFGAFGLVNIADPADADGFGYPVLSVEFIIDADPDLIFYTNCCGDTPETIAARPGWDSISAVRSGAMYELDDDLASRWGPRLVEFFRLVAAAVGEATNP
ncbi:MAG: ABC transporter substrate-binding protein [Acidimicrobiia bacterium]|nr:ABC transporter substrate-binding protein [Acidimicrobiia bacterium]